MTEAQLREHAAKVGAHLVLTCTELTNTAEGPVGADSSYRRAGAVTDTVTRADFTALYFVRYKDPIGLYFDGIDDTTRTRLKAPNAAKVLVVVDKSPAARAGIRVNDIVLKIDGVPMSRYFDYYALMDQRRGQTMDFLVERAGKLDTKTVRVLP